MACDAVHIRAPTKIAIPGPLETESFVTGPTMLAAADIASGRINKIPEIPAAP